MRLPPDAAFGSMSLAGGHGHHQAPQPSGGAIVQQLAALLLALASALAATPAGAIDESQVKEKWHTPFHLYLTAKEAYAMKTADPEHVLFLDVRTRQEVRYIGIADQVDANIPYRFDSSEWREKSDGIHGTFRRPLNFDFEAAVGNALRAKGLDKSSPIILMCTSGSRAPYAATALHDAGFTRVYTQVEGFEGIKAKSGENEGKRVVAGWKNEGLPWGYDLKASKMYFNFEPKQEAEAEGVRTQ
jgi:rhodanese-related sulfurtransferase